MHEAQPYALLLIGMLGYGTLPLKPDNGLTGTVKESAKLDFSESNTTGLVQIWVSFDKIGVADYTTTSPMRCPHFFDFPVAIF
jgi:hypothetical protein